MTPIIQTAIQMMDKARSPYSKYRVGAAVETIENKIFGGCNVENASYPLSNCAERTALFTDTSEIYSQLKGLAVATENGGIPCRA